MTALIFVSAFLLAIGTYVDKMIIDEGISQKNYFYYMCLTMIPFSLFSLFVEIRSGLFYFEFSASFVLLLILAAFLRFFRQKSFVSCYRELQPFEFESYMPLSLVFSYLFDLLLGTQTFHVMKAVSIVLIFAGIALVNSLDFKLKGIEKYLFIRIFCELTTGYIVYAVLKQCSNSLFILLLNFLLTMVFTPVYKPWKKEMHISTKLFFLIVLQQTFGFSVTYLNNILSGLSVTLYQFVSPVSLLLITCTAFVVKSQRKPSCMNLIGMMSAIAGVLIMNVYF